MSFELFDGREIKVLSIADATAGEHIIEFIDRLEYGDQSVVSVFNRGNSWRSARVSINPRIEDVPADFMMWALEVSRRRMGYAVADGS